MSFLEIFEPGLKYLREEKDRQKILAVKPSHGGGAPLASTLMRNGYDHHHAEGRILCLIDPLDRHGPRP
jgi:hypothetical protein